MRLGAGGAKAMDHLELGLYAMPFLLAAVLALLFGNGLVNLLARRSARQPVSGDAPATHQAKQGTPTMGGLLIIGTAAVAAVGHGLLAPPEGGGRRLLLAAVVGTLILAGFIGLMDDLGKARKKENKAGLSERMKLAMQVLVAAGFLLILGATEQAGVTTVLTFGSHQVDLGIWYYPLGLLYICAFGNAANFTDGLDGLLAGVTCIAALTLAATVSTLFSIVGIFYGAVAGACAGFLWFNAHPARVFMGDTGSLALGMGLAAAALAAKQEILLLAVGAVYLLEIGSMMLQRYVFKWRRVRRGIEYAKANRVFRRAPLHHHFEELGWPETRVVTRFWILGLLAAALGLFLAPQLSPVRYLGMGMMP